MASKQKSVTAEETFSSLKQTIKSKFISEEEIPESERSKEPEPDVPKDEVDDRPLYFQLKENRQKNEEAFEAMFKLSSRIKKIDPEEFEFYESLEKKELDREKEIKRKEEEGMRLFKFQQQNKSVLDEERASQVQTDAVKTTAVPEVLKKKKDIQKEILGNGIVLKKRGANHTTTDPSESSGLHKKSKSEITTPALKKTMLVADYGSDSD